MKYQGDRCEERTKAGKRCMRWWRFHYQREVAGNYSHRYLCREHGRVCPEGWYLRDENPPR